MRLLLYEKMVRIKRDAEWSVALGKAVERLDLGVGFKNSDLDSGMDTLVREIEKKIRGNMEQPNPCGHLEAEIVQSKEANHVLSQRILELESARAVAIERAEKAEACEQLLCDHINSLSREVARMHDALARDFALMVKLSCNRDQLSAAEQERDLALERVKALEWKRFSSAPRDGTEFIVCYPLQGNVKQLVNWNTVHGHWESKGEPATGIMHQGCLWIPIPDMQASLSATEKG